MGNERRSPVTRKYRANIGKVPQVEHQPDRLSNGHGAFAHPIECMLGRLVEDAVDSIDLCHVVLVDDPYLSTPLAFGPFPSPIAAAEFADTFADDMTYPGCEDPLRIQLIPLRPVRSGPESARPPEGNDQQSSGRG